MRKVVSCVAAAAGFAAGLGTVWAQFGRGAPDWMGVGGDAQRSFWVRSDSKISTAAMGKPGFGLAWKVKLSEEASPMTTLDRYIGYRGFRSLGFVGSTSGELTAIDTDLGRVEWTKRLAGKAGAAGSGACGGGMTSGVARSTSPEFPGGGAGRGAGMGGRGAAAKSDVGEPGEGGVTIKEVAARAAMNSDAGRGRAPARGAAAYNPFGPRVLLLNTISTDGQLHSMYVSNGEEPKPPMPFLPAGAHALGLMVIDEVAYAATANGCGGAANGLWALDIASQQTGQWTTSSEIVGDGPAFGPDATVYATTKAGELVALEPKTLKLKGTYRAGQGAFTTSPLVFEYKTKTIVAAATDDDRIHVVNAGSLTGKAYTGAAKGALASWQDAAGTRWIVGTHGESIEAWKVTGDESAPTLQTAWNSREPGAVLTPIIVNGVVFAVSNSSPAVLHALDGATGKEFWNSGKTIAASVRESGLSVGNSYVYLGTTDGTIYAFGFPIEH